MAIRYIDGGRDRFVEFVQMAVLNELPESKKWWDIYTRLLTSERERVNFDDVCAASGVQPNRLMSEIVSTVMEAAQDAGNLVAAATHPAVVAALAESAQRISGKYTEVSHKDRIAFLTSNPARFIPVAKGPTVHVNASANAAAAAAASEEPSVPPFAQDMEQLAPARQHIQGELAKTPAFLEGDVSE